MTIGKEFLEKTKFQNLMRSDQSLGYPYPPLELEYADTDVLIDLPDLESVSTANITVTDAIEKRISVRDYSTEPISMEELSYLLWCTQGVKKVIRDAATFRTVPSAGARHALETYILANNVKGLESGLYRFLPIEHKLLQVNTDAGISDRIAKACLGQDFVKKNTVTFIWTAVAYRMTYRYGERGYRYLHLDAGHVCQNLYLSAESIGCGVCAIAAFLDDELNDLLGADGEEEFAIYVATVGKV
ncbi:SagB-type dehydrogenase family enzyme [Methanohalophilus levihalophilus]|uniref:SagB/ThcOx family dehydrogenase n=1 Tax=Methanohalophilus levihalophilus TaxID=1431282 RepID=UPI001AE8A9EE|nr:SagB/ThcOx family dehydrogenase [Methanohalophilus levihalophilus]MBP2030026.1 SagB-type dehydrogenase family enzyme [Methanohalophilus levihalophilus]